MNIAQENELYLYIKIQYCVTSLKSRYPTAKFKKYQENATVGGAFQGRFVNGPELTNWCIFYELPEE